MAETASALGEEQAQAPVTVSLADLESGAVPLSALEEAFGPASLGIIVVEGLPHRFADLRRRVLSYSSRLADLPAAELQKLESPGGKYLTGWSRGRESLRPGVPDTLKGSYYVNCAFHARPGLECAPSTSPAGKDYSAFTEYTTPNLWPDETSTGLHGFRAACEELAGLIIDAAALVARACDRFALANVEGYADLCRETEQAEENGVDDRHPNGAAHRQPPLEASEAGGQGEQAFKPGYLERVVRSSTTTKARLLHYFPSSPKNSGDAREDGGGAASDADGDEDDWCGAHVDHGCLTGLTSAMYVDEAAHSPTAMSRSNGDTQFPPLPELTLPPTPAERPGGRRRRRPGLYISSRAGIAVPVAIPRDCLAFQTGLALEVATGGALRAVPHRVRGGAPAGVARNTLAVFTQPALWEVVDRARGTDFAGLARRVVDQHY